MLYLIQQPTLYTLKSGDTAPQPYIQGLAERWKNDPYEITALFVASGVLYGFNQLDWTFFSISEADGAPAYGERLKLNRSTIDPGANIRDMVLMDGTLYASIYSYSQDSGREQLYSFDTTTGAMKKYKMTAAQIVLPYQDGKLLLVLYDTMNMWDDVKNTYKRGEVVVFDPATEQATPFIALDNGHSGGSYDGYGVAYDENTGMLYYAMTNEIYSVGSDGKPRLCAYLPDDSYSFQANNNAALMNGSFAVLRSTGLFVRNTDPQYLATQRLVIGSFQMNETDKLAAAQMGVPVVLTGKSGYDINDLLTADDNVDIYCVSLKWCDLNNLMRKGYCYDLGQNDALAAYSNQLFPVLYDALSYNGTLYAIPYEVQADVFGSSPPMFQQLGLEIPQTFDELCDFLTLWAQEYTGEADTHALNSTNHRSTLIRLALNTYQNSLQAADLPLTTVNTQEMRRMLEAVDHVPTDALDRQPSVLQTMYLLTDMYRITPGHIYYNRNDMYAQQALPLKMESEEVAPIPLHVYAYYINPRSKNIPLAMQYLEAYYAALTEPDWISLSFEHTQPLESKSYQQSIENIQQSIAALEAQLAAATDPLAVVTLREWVEDRQNDLKDHTQYNRYTHSPESIAAYHAYIQNAFVVGPSPLNTDEFWVLTQRYANRQITLQQFLQEADAKLRMMQMEQ